MLFFKDKRKWNLPGVLFLGKLPYYYEVLDYRMPKKGEYFISGAIPEIYKAPNDISQPYLIAGNLIKARQRTVWVKA